MSKCDSNAPDYDKVRIARSRNFGTYSYLVSITFYNQDRLLSRQLHV